MSDDKCPKCGAERVCTERGLLVVYEYSCGTRVDSAGGFLAGEQCENSILRRQLAAANERAEMAESIVGAIAGALREEDRGLALADVARELLAERDRLREAIRPFAEHHDVMVQIREGEDDSYVPGDEESVYYESDEDCRSMLTWGDFRKAETAAKAAKEKTNAGH